MNKFFKLAVLLLLFSCHTYNEQDNIALSISFPDELAEKVYDGRLLLLLSDNNEKEPRFQIGEGLFNQIVFGKNVENFKAGHAVEFTSDDFGYPYESLKDIPPGDYYIQAFISPFFSILICCGSL